MIPGTTLEPKRITPSKTLSYFTQGNALLVFTALQQQPVQNKTDLTERIKKGIDPSTITEIISDQQDRGLVRLQPDQGHYETTPLGNLSLQAYSDLLSEIGWKGVELLAKSQSVLSILKHLDNDAATLSDLVEDDSICASRSTISSYLSELETMGWVERGPPYKCSPRGTDVLDAYSEYASHVARLAERRQFLRHFDLSGLPLEALRGTEMTAASEGDTDAPTQAFVDGIEPDFDHVRGVTPIINKQYVQAFLPLIRSDCQIELIGDRSVLNEANSTYLSAFAAGVLSPTTTFLVSNEPITIGIAIFDHEIVWLGAYGWSRRDRAVLTGSNDALLNWASNAYEMIRENASPPSKSIISSIKRGSQS